MTDGSPESNTELARLKDKLAREEEQQKNAERIHQEAESDSEKVLPELEDQPDSKSIIPEEYEDPVKVPGEEHFDDDIKTRREREAMKRDRNEEEMTFSNAVVDYNFRQATENAIPGEWDMIQADSDRRITEFSGRNGDIEIREEGTLLIVTYEIDSDRVYTGTPSIEGDAPLDLEIASSGSSPRSFQVQVDPYRAESIEEVLKSLVEADEILSELDKGHAISGYSQEESPSYEELEDTLSELEEAAREYEEELLRE